MLDYNTKFDRRESTTVLDGEEIRELVRSRLGGFEIESVSVLTGGFVNSNYRLVLRDNRSLVLRIAARLGDLKKELSVLKRVHDAVPVPAVVAEEFSGPRPFALLEFIEGMLLSDSLGSLAAVDLTRVAFEAGISLQAIHSFDLGKAGFFNENFVFSPTFENFAAVFTIISVQISRLGGFENGSGKIWLRVRWNTCRRIETNTGRFLVRHGLFIAIIT